jgi:hypothetical protein
MAGTTLIAPAEWAGPRSSLIQGGSMPVLHAGAVCGCPVSDDTACTSSWMTIAQTIL